MRMLATRAATAAMPHMAPTRCQTGPFSSSVSNSRSTARSLRQLPVSLYLADGQDVARPLRRPLGRPPRPPPQRWRPFGVRRGDDQAAEDGEVLEEMSPLHGLRLRRLLLPEAVTGGRRRHERSGEHGGREAGELA